MNFRIKICIIYAFVSLNFNIPAQIPSDANLLICASKFSETNFSGIVSNTQPDIQYEIQRKQDKANWVSLGFILGSETFNWTTFDFRTTNAINSKTIRVRSWIDSDGSGISDWWQFRYFGSVGVDPYGNPEGDGWNNMQKFQNSMDPFQWYMPPKPVLDVQIFDGPNRDAQHGHAILSWQVQNGPIPDYFIIERANRTQHPNTNYQLPPPGARFDQFQTNHQPFVPRFGALGTNRLYLGSQFGAFGTNRPPPGARLGAYGRTNLPHNTRPMYLNPGRQRVDPLVTVTEPFEVVARVPGQPSLRSYRYYETNVDTFIQPLFRIQAHYSPPLYARLNQIDRTSICKTLLSVTKRQTTNGFDLAVMHPIPYARYLLLVRDKNSSQWRASGYFASGTNRNPVYLHVDKKGMMTDGQSPIAMPVVKFLPDVIQPEFTAGWGEDSDGDGLPDIYEVLVTHTEPDNDDTGNTGILDGYKKMTSDRLSNYEKFRCRVDPLNPAQPPATVELKQPTAAEILQALNLKSDLSCEIQIQVRTNGAKDYQPVEQIPWMIYKIVNFRSSLPNEHKNFDLLISWRFSEFQPTEYSINNPGEPFQTISKLVQKLNLQIIEAFRRNLITNSPLSQEELSNYASAIQLAERQEDLDRTVAVWELSMLEADRNIGFYGEVVDLNNNPIANADVHFVWNDLSEKGTSEANTRSDGNGFFSLFYKRGKGLTVSVGKAGYYDTSTSRQIFQFANFKPDQGNRVIFHLRKKGIGADLITSEFGMTGSFQVHVPHDGTPTKIDLMQRKEGDVGQLQLSEIKPDHAWQQATQWSFKIEIPDGGLIGEDDEFAFEAPEGGYESVTEFQFQKDVNWVSNLKTNFYIKFGNPPVYGRLQIETGISYGGATLTYAINPSGSRNLEPK